MKQQPGLVSMMSALMVSILMIVASMGLIVYVNNSTQQGSDDELSLRAYASAEGGVEWAYSRILGGDTTSYSSCTGAGSVPNSYPYVYNQGTAATAFQNAITCLKVSNTSTQVTGSFSLTGPIDSTQAYVYSPIKTIRVQWMKPTDYRGGSSLPTTNYSALPANNGSTPPAIELTIVNYTGTGPTPNSGTINTTPGNPITVRNVLLLADNGTTYSAPTWLSQYSKAVFNCTTAGSYLCDTGNPQSGGSVNICANVTPVAGDCSSATPSGMVTAVYARALYLNGLTSAVSYNLQFYDASNTLITVPISNTTIDVTARSGPVYRRVVAQVPSGAVPAGLNYVIFSDTDICKQFDVPDPATPLTPAGTGCPF